MLENRLQEWLTESQVAGQTGPSEAFVPCPCSIMTGYTPAQIAFVEEIYRRAQAMLEAQFRPLARTRQPEFSWN